MPISTRPIAALVVALVAGVASAADPAWQLVNPLPVELDLDDVACANGLHVAVGERGVVLTSTDGVTWQRQASPTGMDLRGVVWHPPLWVAVGAGGTVLTSRDGVEWRERDPVESLDLEAVASGPHGLVAVGRDGAIVGSPDGVRWVRRSSPVPVNLRDVAWVGDDWVAVGNGGTVLNSVDSVLWQIEGTWGTEHLRGVANNGPVTVVVGEGRVLRREAGSAWQGRYDDELIGAHDVAWCGERFVAVGSRWVSSTDGLVWSGGVGAGFKGVTCGESGVVAVGSRGRTAFGHDPQAWTVTSSFTSGTLDRVTSDGERAIALVALGRRSDLFPKIAGPAGKDFPWRSPEILVTDDGVSWRRSFAPGAYIQGAVAGGGRFVVIGFQGDEWMRGWIKVSEDGLNWTTSWADWGPDAITWDGSRFIAVGHNRVLTSTDGMTWTEHPSGPPGLWMTAVASDGRTIVVASYYAGIMTSTGSPDGEWVEAGVDLEQAITALAWGAGRFVAVGQDGVILSSADGIAWQREISPTGALLLDVTWSGDGFAAVGTGGVVLKSPDGRRWRLVETGLDGDLFGVARLGRGLIAVGDHGLIQREVIEEPGLPPDAAFTWRPTEPQSGLPVRFVDRSQGAPTSWRWHFGDGDRGDGQEVVHAFDQPGTYTASLWAENNAGSSSASAEITVGPPCAAPEAPVLEGPGQVASDERYAIRWSDVESTDYRIEESQDSGFSGDVWYRTTPRTDHAISHTWMEGRRFFYRVRAEHSCWQGTFPSDWSNTVEVQIEPVATSPGEHIVVVPAASSGGLGGSHWSSDVVMHNPWAEPVPAMLFLVGSDRDPGPAFEVVLEAGECVRVEDAARVLANGPASGAVMVGSDHELLVSGQVFNQRPDGRYGHAAPGLRKPGRGDAFLPVPLWRTDQLRTNAGAFGMREGVTARLVALEDGHPVGAASLTVGSHIHVNVSDVVAAMGLDRGDGMLGLMTRRAGTYTSSHRSTWVSVVDNRSGDAAVWTPRLPGATWFVVPEVRSGAGWRTDVVLLNPGIHPAEVAVGRFGPLGAEEPVRLEVPAWDSLVLEDVLASVLGLDGEAVLRITPSSPELEVTARTWAQAGDGSRGLRAYAFRDDEVITHLEKGLLVGLRQSADASTRIGVVNPREVPVDVEVRRESQDGTVVHQVEFELRPFDHFLIDLGGFGLPERDCDCIVVQLTTDSLDGAFIAWAVITDAASGDEMLIPAVKRER